MKKKLNKFGKLEEIPVYSLLLFIVPSFAYRSWLKASISLTVVMGITWIIGVLVMEVEGLFALAFIFTIFVAFQGLFIFILFVLLQKPVRDSCAKWWKATVSESDYLSKYFGQANITSTLVSTAITECY